MTNMTKQDKLKDAVTWFKGLEKPNATDVFVLCVAASMSTRPGSGLCWSQVVEIINSVYNEEDK